MFEHEVFRRNNRYGDWYVRHDFAWVGFGLCRGSMVDLRGYHVWINFYRRFPRLGRWVLTYLPHRAGYSTQSERKWIAVSWFGSMREPWLHWTFRIGRLYIGADSPAWLIRWKQWRNEQWIKKHYDGYDGPDETYPPTDEEDNQ